MKNLWEICSIILLSQLFMGCASVAGFEEARTIGEGNHELNPSGNLVYMSNYFDEDGEDVYFNMELKYRYGVADKVDIGVRLSYTMNLGLIVKFNILDNPEKKFALGSGLELSTTWGLASEVHLPLYFSYYPSESVIFNFAPRYINQNISTLTDSKNFSYLGANIGWLFGASNQKLGIDLGYFQRIDGKGALFTVGLGGKFLISKG